MLSGDCRPFVALVGVSAVLSLVGCATPTPAPNPAPKTVASPYPEWGRQLNTFLGGLRTIDDVNHLLGSAPALCETFEPVPIVGIQILNDEPIVASIDPAGAAASSGIREGDRILKVNRTPVFTGGEVVAALRASTSWDSTIIVTTRSGVRSFTLERPVAAKLCTWHINEPYPGGSAGQRAQGPPRYFRASCRDYDGRLVGCQATWQE